MRKLLLALMLCFFASGTSFAAQVPKEVQDFVNKTFPNTNFRFDGVIILPDNTMFFPIFPAKLETVENFNIKSTYAANLTF